MQWQQVRQRYPSQWLLVEAIKAHTEGNQRVVEDLAIVDVFPDSRAALESYVDFHEQTPEREYYVVHTDRETLDILQRRWLGIRGRS
jgi:hypothetical protein